MNPVSTSPERNTFGRKNYIRRQIENDKSVDPLIVEVYNSVIREDMENQRDPKWAENNLEYDLRSTNWILEKVRASDAYAQNLYAALCNNEFQKLEVFSILKDQTWGCSWRYAGGIIAHMRQIGDYIDWYCSGIKNTGNDDDPYGDDPNFDTKEYAAEGYITEEIRNDLKKLGWISAKTDDCG